MYIPNIGFGHRNLRGSFEAFFGPGPTYRHLGAASRRLALRPVEGPSKKANDSKGAADSGGAG